MRQSFVDLTMARHGLLAFPVSPDVVPATASKKSPAEPGQCFLQVTSLHRGSSVHRCVCERTSERQKQEIDARLAEAREQARAASSEAKNAAQTLADAERSLAQAKQAVE
jgi:hypothetical protein